MSDLINRKELLKCFCINKNGQRIPEVDCDNIQVTVSIKDVKRIIREQPTAFDTEKVFEQLNNVLQDLNVLEVISHIDFDSTIQTSLENFLNAFKSEIMRIVKNNACIDELLKGEEL